MKFKIVKVTKLSGDVYYNVKFKPSIWFPFYMKARIGPYERSNFNSYEEAEEVMYTVKGWYVKKKEVVTEIDL